jgi:hypothetical protein
LGAVAVSPGMRRLALIVLVAAVIVGGSWIAYRKLYRCDGCGALDAHRQTWDSLHLADYSYVYEDGGMACCYRVRITVHAGRVVQTQVLHGLTGFSKHPTVDDVFGAARHEMHAADHVTVEYDPRFGFPSSVSVDPNTRTMDDEYGFHIEQFRRLTPANA